MSQKNETNGDLLPGPNERRAMLEQQRDHFRRLGYSYALEVEAIRAQMATTDEEKNTQKKAVRNHEASGRNACAAARRMQEMLDELAEPV